ncbi:MAG TPA: hypothetical protein DCL21_06650 [Alphaproteobacteria bacterium]|nr:hypothetical protein [Alphaproteobacteria bacterium]
MLSLTEYEIYLLSIILIAFVYISFQLILKLIPYIKAFLQWNHTRSIMYGLANLNYSDEKIANAIKGDHSDELIEYLVLSSWFVKNEKSLKKIWIKDPKAANELISQTVIARYKYYCDVGGLEYD